MRGAFSLFGGLFLCSKTEMYVKVSMKYILPFQDMDPISV